MNSVTDYDQETNSVVTNTNPIQIQYKFNFI